MSDLSPDHANSNSPGHAPAPDPYAQKMRRLEDMLLRGRGALAPTTREALAAGRDIPTPLAAYVEKVTRYAYRVTDEDIAALKAAGYSEDQILEATLSVAFGAARLRLAAGLGALAAAEPAPAEPASDGAATDVNVSDTHASVVAASQEQE